MASIKATFKNDCVFAQCRRKLPENGDCREIKHEGSTVTLTRFRGGCWTLSGAAEPVLRAVKARILGWQVTVDDRAANKIVDEAYAQMEADFHASVVAAEVAAAAKKPVYSNLPESTFRGVRFTHLKCVHKGKVTFIALFREGHTTVRGEGASVEAAIGSAWARLPAALVRKVEYAEYGERQKFNREQAAKTAAANAPLTFNPFAALGAK